MLISKADAAYPGKFDFRYNLENVLKETVPEGKGWYIENQAEKPIEGGENALWRKGAFEVRRMDTNEVLYSKIVGSRLRGTAAHAHIPKKRSVFVCFFIPR